METPKRVRIGVIGAGWFASRRHCPEVKERPDAVLAAFARRDYEKLKKMAAHFGVTQTFTDHRDLIRSGTVDGVIICTPHALHYEHVKASLDAGLHVLVEKPLTLDPGQGQELVNLARQKGLALIVAQNPPYWNHCRYLREKLQDGILGQVEAAEIHWVGNVEAVFGAAPMPSSLPGVVLPTLFRHDPALNGGGYFVDGGSHLVCELVWCTGLKVVEVSAQMDNPEWDMKSAVSLRLDNGALATITCTANSAIFDKRAHSLYFCSKGNAFFRGMPFAVTIEPKGGPASTTSEKDLPKPPSPLGNWLDCILRKTKPEMEGETAVHIVAVVEAAYRSARTRQTVRLA
jgi:predicted dehydrogenase